MGEHSYSACSGSTIVHDHSYSTQLDPKSREINDGSADVINEHNYAGRSTSNNSLPRPSSLLLSEGSEIIEGTEYLTHRVPGDGNCFFSCLSLALNGDFSQSQNYRNLICQGIVQNWDIFGAFATMTHDLPSPQVSLYWMHMIDGNGWAGACEVKMACNILGTNITIWLKGRTNADIRYTREMYRPDDTTDANITLLLSHNHYTLLTEYFPTERLQAQFPDPSHTNIAKKRKTMAEPNKASCTK